MQEEIPKPIIVSILRRKGQTALVEYMDGKVPARVSVPETLLEISEDGKSASVDEADLLMGAPYGVPWEVLLQPISADPVELANALRANGIWRSEDVTANPQGVIGAVLSAFGPALQQINSIALSRRVKEE